MTPQQRSAVLYNTGSVKDLIRFIRNLEVRESWGGARTSAWGARSRRRRTAAELAGR